MPINVWATNQSGWKREEARRQRCYIPDVRSILLVQPRKRAYYHEYNNSSTCSKPTSYAIQKSNFRPEPKSGFLLYALEKEPFRSHLPDKSFRQGQTIETHYFSDWMHPVENVKRKSLDVRTRSISLSLQADHKGSDFHFSHETINNARPQNAGYSRRTIDAVRGG